MYTGLVVILQEPAHKGLNIMSWLYGKKGLGNSTCGSPETTGLYPPAIDILCLTLYTHNIRLPNDS